ncbi:MAG: hypothetical protein K0U72_13500 [Gammaproteobacteria bacterium]|nr:hypothetical protein [Gammaproteobacteria bacterium]
MNKPGNEYGHSGRAFRRALCTLMLVLTVSSAEIAFANNALHKAIEKGKESKALRLIRKDKGIEELTDDGFTPLMLAVNRSQYAVYAALIEKGAALDTPIGPSKFTALHGAVSGGSTDAVRSLVAAGANIEAQDANGVTPWLTAIRRDSSEVAIAILNSTNQTLSTESLDAAIRVASNNGSLELLDRLLPDLEVYRPDLFQSDDFGYDQIHHLARLGLTDSINAILDAGADIDLQVGAGSQGEKGVSALWVALNNGHDGLAQVFIQRGADPMLQGEERSSPLQMQLQKGNAELVDAMIAMSPDLRRNELRDLDSLSGDIHSTIDPISMNALLTECGTPYQAIEGGANSMMVFNGGNAATSQATSGFFDNTSVLQLPDLNVRTAIKIESADPDVTMVLRSQISADGSVCQVFRVDGTYSAMMGASGESELLGLFVNPSKQEVPVPFDAVISYEAGNAKHYYRSDSQWFEIHIE